MADEGSYESRNQEGIDLISIFHRSTTTGWTVVISIPKAPAARSERVDVLNDL